MSEHTSRRWEPDEDGIIRRYAHTHTARQMQAMLPWRSEIAILSHARYIGVRLRKTGAASPACKHPDAVVRQAHELRSQGLYSSEIAAMIGVPQGTVDRWVLGYSRLGSYRDR